MRQPVVSPRVASSIALPVVLLAALLASPAPVAAHAGGVNSQGCHHDRANGTYHCHAATGVRARASSEETYIRPTDPAEWPAPGTYFRNCTEVRAAGAAPLRAGEPGYARHLDRDGDGVACERPRR